MRIMRSSEDNNCRFGRNIYSDYPFVIVTLTALPKRPLIVNTLLNATSTLLLKSFIILNDRYLFSCYLAVILTSFSYPLLVPLVVLGMAANFDCLYLIRHASLSEVLSVTSIDSACMFLHHV